MTTRRELMQWSAATLGVLSDDRRAKAEGWPAAEKKRKAVARLTAARA